MNKKNPERSGLVAVVGLLFSSMFGALVLSSALADTIGVIGTGRVGGALGPRFADLGYTVVYGSRDPGSDRVQQLVARSGDGASATSQRDAAQQADIILLAVPWRATEEVVKSLGDLDGKVIMDAVNPLQRADDGLLEMGVDTSAAQMVQSWAPGARVVKTFNNVNFMVMADPAAAGGPVTVPLAGDDSDAKAQVRQIVEALGFETVDVGPLRMSRELEGMVVLKLVPMFQGRIQDSWEYYFRPYPERGTN